MTLSFEQVDTVSKAFTFRVNRAKECTHSSKIVVIEATLDIAIVHPSQGYFHLLSSVIFSIIIINTINMKSSQSTRFTAHS